MAANCICRVIVYLSPISFFLVTYYLLFSGKKDSRKDASLKERQNGSLNRDAKPLCASNFYPEEGTCVRCPHGQFSLEGWIACLHWLDCTMISRDVRLRHRIGIPGHLNAVKEISLADWQGYTVVHSRCSSDLYFDDCLHGMKMVEGLQGSEFVVQLIGICYGENLEMITGYYKYGSADNVNELLQKTDLAEYNNIKTRFQLCVDYVRILEFLHDSPLGVRVMCDSNDVTKTLSQYLITEDFHLVVNDLDALPEVNPHKDEFIKCGHRELHGDFVAPEQLWPYGDSIPFSDEEMPPYDEKIDIWRIPNVVDRLLDRVHHSNLVRRLLLEVHESCKLENPSDRPSASEVLSVFLSVQRYMESGIKDEM